MLTAILSRTCLASSMNSRCRQHSRRAAHSVDGDQAQSERQGPAHTPAQQLQTESSRIGRHRRSSPYRNLPCFQQLSCSAPLLVLVLGLGCKLRHLSLRRETVRIRWKCRLPWLGLRRSADPRSAESEVRGMQGFQPRGGRPDLLYFGADGALLQGLAPTSQPSARGRNPGRGGGRPL